MGAGAVFACVSARAATYYVHATRGDDSNRGTSPSAPWKNCPGMTAYSGPGSLAAGDTVLFDRGCTWSVSGEYGLHVKGGVSYIGDRWGKGALAIIRPVSNLRASIIDIREDHPSLPTLVRGFEVDGNHKYGNGVGVNHPYWSHALVGAVKRIENLHIHHTWSDLTDPDGNNRYFYGIILRATAGLQGAVENVEIVGCKVNDVSRDGIALYPSDDDRATLLSHVVVRGCEVYNTALDPVYRDPPSIGGNGIIAKGQVDDAVIERNFVHDTNAVGIAVSGNQSNHFGVGAKNIQVRYNIVTANGTGGIRLATDDPKELSVYGNIAYNEKLAGFLTHGDLRGVNSLRIYNNTFYNAPVILSSPQATFALCEFRNNIVFVPSGVPITGADRFTAASNNVTADPHFTDVSRLPTGFAGAFGQTLAPDKDGLSLRRGSPAIGAGVNLGAPYDRSIYSSIGRASRWDIGAYQSRLP